MSSPDVHINSPSPENIFSRKYFLISLALSVLTMGGVIYYTYTPGVLDHLAFKRLPGLGIALVVSFLRVWFTAAKFRFLSNGALSWLASFRIVLVWDFTSAVTPSTIGGAPMATYAMTKEGTSLGESTAMMLYSVLLDQIWFAIAIPILLISGVFYEVVPPEIGFVGEASMLTLYIVLLSYASLLAYAVLVNPAVIKKVVNLLFSLPVLNRYQEKMNAEAVNLEQYANELRKKPFSFLLKALFFAIMTWLARIALPTIVILSLLPAPEILSTLRSLAMNLAFLVVPTPGGSGGVEGLFVLFQGPLFFVSETAVSMPVRESFIGVALFLWRMISYYISIAIGMGVTSWYLNKAVAKQLNTD